MGKTLVIAEKPSVARDLAGALPGSFKQSKDKTHLEGDDYVITWAVGHLVGLAEPDAYDPKLKKWRFADLPILPEQFKLVPNDERGQEAAVGDPQADAQRRDRRDRERLRRRARGRADLRLRVRDRGGGEAGQAAVAQLDDQEGDRGGLRAPARRARRWSTLEAAARSRSEADWVVGMNATRAASIRLRAAFDGAVSLGRVQTPTLALLAKPRGGDPRLQARALLARRGRLRRDRASASTRAATWAASGSAEDEAAKIVKDVEGQPGEITKLEKKEEKERPQLLYDLTSLQRHANTLYGFSARRTLAAAQKLYEEHKAITYPRTNSRFLTGDMVAEIRPTAELVGHNPQYRKGAEYVTALKELPLGRVVNDAKVAGPPRADPHQVRARPLAHGRGRAEGLRPGGQALPGGLPPRCRVRAHARGDHRGRARVPHQRPACCSRPAGRPSTARRPSRPDAGEDDSGGDQALPKLEQGEAVETRSVESLRKETQPPRRFTDASLLGAMETAGKDIEDAELREAMKDSGIGTPATRAPIIERLINVGYMEREGRALVCHREGHPGDQAARRAPAHLGRADRRVGAPPRPDRARRGLAARRS